MAFRLLEKYTMDDIEWVKSVREKVTIARTEVARGEALDGPTVVNEILDRYLKTLSLSSDRSAIIIPSDRF